MSVRHAHRILHRVCATATILALLLVSCGDKGCGKTSTVQPGGDDTDNGTSSPGHRTPRPDEGKGEEGEGKGGISSLRPRERERLIEALQALKNNVFLADPDGFRESFLSFPSLKSVITGAKGKAAWSKRLKEAGGDELDYEGVYKKSIRALYDRLRAPGPPGGLSAEALQSIRSTGVPPDFLFADTFASPLGRNFIVTLSGFRNDEGLKGLFRLRAMPHHNQRKWYLHGDERIEAFEALVYEEARRVGEAMKAIAAEQEAFRRGKHLDRDGDGKGEFGFLPELAGLTELRGTERRHDGGTLPPLLREVSVNGVVLLGTHLIRLHLPGETEKTHGDRMGALESAGVTDLRERVWCALAWPVAKGCGEGLYFVGPSGNVLRAGNPSSYHGLEAAPPPAVGFKEKNAPLPRVGAPRSRREGPRAPESRGRLSTESL